MATGMLNHASAWNTRRPRPPAANVTARYWQTRPRGVFNGRILVQQDAQQTSADLTNRNLLLDRGAEINTKPELEIYADDVKCAHGSTTGQLDRTALFYLLSRGLAPTEAHNMLVRAFAAELLTDLDIEALAGRAVAAMNALRLDDL